MSDGTWQCDGCGKEWAFHEDDPERPWDLDDPNDDDPSAHEIDNYPALSGGGISLCDRCYGRSGLDICDEQSTIEAATRGLRRRVET
jgi:hypothetical protein